MDKSGFKSIFVAKLCGAKRLISPDMEIFVLPVFLFSLCKKTPTTSLFSFLKQSFTKSKLLDFKNFESLVFGAFLSKTGKTLVFLLALFNVFLLRNS
jgi:hypothetical protein